MIRSITCIVVSRKMKRKSQVFNPHAVSKAGVLFSCGHGMFIGSGPYAPLDLEASQGSTYLGSLKRWSDVQGRLRNRH